MRQKRNLRFLQSLFSRPIGIDLGTATTRISVAGRGIVVREPSVVLRESGHLGDTILAGSDAHQSLGRTSAGIAAICPVRGGVLADFFAAKDMLSCFLRRINSRWHAPSLILSVPIGATQAERRAVHELAETVGASAALLVDAPIAAALGARLPIEQVFGSMIIDVGAGKTEVAVFNLGRIVQSQSIRTGGETLDRAIATWLRGFHGVAVGDKAAEKVKICAAYVKCDSGDDFANVKFTTSVRGIGLSSGLPVEIDVTGDEIADVIAAKIDDIVAIVVATLENLPVEISSDIAERGILMTGAAAVLPGLQQRIANDVGIAAFVIEDCADAVASGLGLIVEDVVRFRPFLHAVY